MASNGFGRSRGGGEDRDEYAESLAVIRRLAGRVTWEAGRAYGGIERLLFRWYLKRRFDMPPAATKFVALGTVGGAGEGRNDYQASPWDILRRILRPSEVSTNDVFLDVGCGMGTVLLEAADRYPFRRVIGVDVVDEFADVARTTLQRNLPRLNCNEAEVIATDLMDYEIPGDVTVVFVANPLVGSGFDAFVRRLITSVDQSPRRIRLIYLMPVEEGRLEQTGRVRLVRVGRRGLRRWAKADYLRMYEIVPGTSS